MPIALYNEKTLFDQKRQQSLFWIWSIFSELSEQLKERKGEKEDVNLQVELSIREALTNYCGSPTVTHSLSLSSTMR